MRNERFSKKTRRRLAFQRPCFDKDWRGTQRSLLKTRSENTFEQLTHGKCSPLRTTLSLLTPPLYNCLCRYFHRRYHARYCFLLITFVRERINKYTLIIISNEGRVEKNNIPFEG